MTSNNIDWNDVIKKEARGTNDEVFGEVQDIQGNYVLVQKGIIDKENFYIPKDQAERFDVSKESQEDQATITKKPVTETKTVEVPLTREEVSIERRPASGQTEAQSPIQSEEEITIPLKREEAQVSKKPYVKEEAVIKKKAFRDTKEITEDVTSEELDTSNVDKEY